MDINVIPKGMFGAKHPPNNTVKYGGGMIMLLCCISSAVTGAFIREEGIMNRSTGAMVVAQKLQPPDIEKWRQRNYSKELLSTTHKLLDNKRTC